jgi:preprotein translocase subunit SecE
MGVRIPPGLPLRTPPAAERVFAPETVMFDKIKKFLRETRVELSKVTWPNRREVVSSTLVIIVMSALLAVIIGVFDFGLSKLIDWILSLR